ncbi:hypothetical protein OSTOST_05429 [Ostertagia ostertagi]
MKRLPEHLTPTDFYHGLRPFLQGYKALSPHEIVFEGMEELGPMAYCGASAAQSSTIQLIDAFLKEKKERFCTNIESTCHANNRELIYWVEAESPIQKSTEGRQQALEALTAFRSSHLNTVALYILTQMKGSSQATGTGGSFTCAVLEQCQAQYQMKAFSFRSPLILGTKIISEKWFSGCNYLQGSHRDRALKAFFPNTENTIHMHCFPLRDVPQLQTLLIASEDFLNCSLLTREVYNTACTRGITPPTAEVAP